MKNRPSRRSGSSDKVSPSHRSKGHSGRPFAGKDRDSSRPYAAKPHSAKDRAGSAFKPKTKSEKGRPTSFRDRIPLPAVKGVLLFGAHAVKEAWLNPKRRCLTLYASESGEREMEETLRAAEKRGLKRPEIRRVEKDVLERFLPRGSVHQGLVLDVEPLPEMSLDDLLGRDPAASLVVILDQVTDPHNVGAILRSAAAFGAEAVIVTERGAPGEGGTLAKTACGAFEHVPLISVVNLSRALEDLQREGFWCIGLAEGGEKGLSACSLSSGKIVLVLGAEGDGLRRLTREHCDELARLPTGGAIGSLNVSNAAAVALYEVKRQRTSV